MDNIVNTIANSVLSKNLIDCTTDELATLAAKHPYSGALQLLYAQKLKQDNSIDFSSQWQKTLLYFNNPLFVQQVVTISSAAERRPETIVLEAQSTDKKENAGETLPAVMSEAIAKEPDEDPVTKEIRSESGESELANSNSELAQLEEIETVTQANENEIPIPGLKIEPIDPEKAALSFTPYHTIDYFASQGIKLGEDIKAGDRFGNQLKSFTSWLKEMRRLPEAEVTSKFSRFENNSIEKMAESSLTGENAITEAMAQVWIKQNNPQKAIDIYKKLSLQNPAKSAFFAAKIDHLKKKI